MFFFHKCAWFFVVVIVFSETHYMQLHYNAIQYGYISMLIEIYKAVALENAERSLIQLLLR